MSQVVPAGSPDENQDIPVGQALARLRRERKVTGAELGKRVGLSQATISRIEHGNIVPSVQEVDRIARGLELSEEVIRHLVGIAERSQNQMTDWRLRDRGVVAGQHDIAHIEATSQLQQAFTPLLISGLLQTAEYARFVLAGVDRSVGSPGQSTLPQTVSARVQRQEVLADATKQFVFVMPEVALQNLVCGPVEMAAQIDRIREVARQDNVSLLIIPRTTQLAIPPVNAFFLYDHRIVMIDLFNTFLASRGREDLALYRRVFEVYEAQATANIDEILDNHLRYYLELAARSVDQRDDSAH